MFTMPCINNDSDSTLGEPNHGIGEELRAVEEVDMVVGVKLNDRKGMSLRPFYRLNNKSHFTGHGSFHGCPRAPVFTLRR